MRTVDQIKYAGSKVCPCGLPAVRFTTGTWTCARCLSWDGTIYGTARIRSTCGVPDRTRRWDVTEEAA